MQDYEVIGPSEAALYARCLSCGHTLADENQQVSVDPTPVTAPTVRAEVAARTRFPPGSLLAKRYQIIEMLGSGGAGEVYRAQDLTLNQPVALKLFPHLEKEHGALERLHREVRLARQISHGNVCRVFDIGEASGHPFITMEFVGGEDLHALLRRIGRLSTAKALQISRQLCAGLAAAHDAGVLHRDLKPANVMLDERGNVRITDFGLAVLAAEPHELNAGTPAYMAPEQLAGKEVTSRSDLYSLGLVMHELFTGKRTSEAGTPAHRMRERRSQNPTMPGVHPLIQQTVARCLDPNPVRRPASAVRIAAILSRAARLGASAPPRPMMRMPEAASEGSMSRLAWTLLCASLAGTALILMLAPASTGLALTFDSRGPDGSVAHVFTWLWCLGLQLFLTLAASAFVLRTTSTSNPNSEAVLDAMDDRGYSATLQ